MRIRNFWSSVRVDGRINPVEFSPQAANGGFTQVIYVRQENGPVVAARITGEAYQDGTLVLYVEAGGDYRDSPEQKVSESAIAPYSLGSGHGYRITVKGQS